MNDYRRIEAAEVRSIKEMLDDLAASKAKPHKIHFNPYCKDCHTKLKNIEHTNRAVCPKCWRQYESSELYEGTEEDRNWYLATHEEELKATHEIEGILERLLMRRNYINIRPNGLRSGTAVCEFCGGKLDIGNYNQRLVQKRVEHIVGSRLYGQGYVVCPKCIEPYSLWVKESLG